MGEKPKSAASGRNRWLFALLERSGSILEGTADGIYHYRLGPTLQERLGRDRLSLTFRKRLAGKQDAELASAGSWLHDQLLRYARERGRTTRFYLPCREEIDREALLGARRPAFQGTEKQLEERYGMMIQFTFRLSYYSEPPAESVLHILYDCERKKILKRPLVKRYLDEARETPREGLKEPKAPNIKRAFKAAWEHAQETVEKRVREIENEGRPFLERELQTVELYYRQLIGEEKRLLKARASRRGQEESREKIELLKLEWERRVQEESDRFRPQVVATLAAIAQVLVPLERWRCLFKNNGKDIRRDFYLDTVRGDTWEATRRSNGTR